MASTDWVFLCFSVLCPFSVLLSSEKTTGQSRSSNCICVLVTSSTPRYLVCDSLITVEVKRKIKIGKMLNNYVDFRGSRQFPISSITRCLVIEKVKKISQVFCLNKLK